MLSASCTSVDLRWLALTLVKIKLCTQVEARFSPFGHPTQVNTSWVMYNNLLTYLSALKWDFCDSCVLVRKLVRHSLQVSTQVQLAPTCDYLRVRLSVQGFIKTYQPMKYRMCQPWKVFILFFFATCECTGLRGNLQAPVRLVTQRKSLRTSADYFGLSVWLELVS